MIRTTFYAAIAATALTLPCAAQETITSDRPGIGSGSGVVTPGVFQVELGGDYLEDDTNRTYSFGQMLVRLGIPGIELEFFLNSYSVTRTDFLDGPIEGEGLLDFALGGKAPLVRSDRVGVSVQGIVAVPTGADIWTSDEFVPSLNLLADFGLSDRFAVSVNTGYSAGPGAVTDQFTLFVTPGLSLNDGFGVYAGWAGFFDDTDAHFAEAGVTLVANRNLQFDMNSGWDLESDAWFLGAGVAFRWGG